ncbi:MAG: cysteine--tRNA ligase [Desulfobulbaceae bacterium]|nr:cysteine--tRNA ligase [Desulfobulbaceae bacterium]
MTIRIYDTKNGQKNPFIPLTEGHVKMYVCGITAYDYCHIGHARSTLIFDMIVNYLRFRGYAVTYVRNFTDIDDKIINRANDQGTTSEELANRFIDEFYTDMAQLGVTPPDIEPKATDHIPEIIDLITELIHKRLAYQVGNDVYFSVNQFPGYGSLSGRIIEDLQAGARISVNESKNNPMDFALWKGSKPGEPTWDSPWGPGRPGWHIECSAMSRKYLGNSFDIHGGGEDLVFPHHENEVAQSEGASGVTFVNYWIHHAFVTISNEKMSKSLHNFLTIREVLQDHHPEALRLMVFSTHYRHPLDFSDSALQDAQTGVKRLYNCLADCQQLPAGHEGVPISAKPEEVIAVNSLNQRFCEAMDNDFNTAQALGVLFDGAKAINRIRQSLPKKPAVADISLLKSGAEMLVSLADILGLLRQDPVSFFAKQQTAHLKNIAMTEDELLALITERLAAKARKDWARADEIRDQLLAKKIELKDGANGTTWVVLSS